ncbi:hypothetical protein H4R99_002672 [Coemansia sp. RSA 1722]|nr:hypothetical protein LPJ57_004119 [Coemansia sp. RSA 486]KAJ2234173.1 hypothetical protein IWW45_003607 [Coemansia sp. RSA 485]KAJ2595504.1 hypothetical protein GGF39_003797 [Coemansia sp. RSA 1721]KAJ2602520.1 hypothetical protein H4R99_002672 [Coemansia sp. RSA 1722]
MLAASLLTSSAPGTPKSDDATKKPLEAASKPLKLPKSRPSPIFLKDEEIEEKHVRGWGNGGQKLNKTSSCVQLLHIPTNTMVICQDTRSLQQNRKIARKRLAEKLDHLANGEQSKTGKKILKLKARKHKQKQRAKRKYTSKEAGSGQDGQGELGEKEKR